MNATILLGESIVMGKGELNYYTEMNNLRIEAQVRESEL
jgi:hypothetical protein